MTRTCSQPHTVWLQDRHSTHCREVGVVARFEITSSKIIVIVHDSSLSVVAERSCNSPQAFWTCHLFEWAEIRDNICNTSTCIGTIDVRPESFYSAVPQGFHLTITDQLQDQWKRDTAFSDTASKTVIVVTLTQGLENRSFFHLKNSYMFILKCKQRHLKRKGRWIGYAAAPPIPQLLKHHLLIVK